MGSMVRLEDHVLIARVVEIAKRRRATKYQKAKTRSKELARAYYERKKAEHAALVAMHEEKRAKEQAEFDRQCSVERNRLAKKYKNLYALIDHDDFKTWYEAETGEEWNALWESIDPESVDVEDLFLDPYFIPEEAGAVLHLQALYRKIEITRALKTAVLSDLRKMDAPSRRIAMQKYASPDWRDKKKILHIYKCRDRLNVEFPEFAPFHVDHIIPIQADDVCGLHVHSNLRVVPARENMAKSNAWSEDEIEENYCWSEKLEKI